MNNKVNYTIKELPIDERPREKLYKYGPKILSDAELLAIIIRTGSRNESSVNLARRILDLDNIGLSFLKECSIQELTKVQGIGKCKAAQILAAIELGRRVTNIKKNNIKRITSPLDVKRLLMDDMKDLKKEYFKGIMLDTKNNIICIEDISIGSLNSSIVHPREVFKIAIKRSSASIILIHNHPSGDPTPSKEDINITHRLIEVGDIVGIKILDHIIIGDNKYISFKEEDII